MTEKNKGLDNMMSVSAALQEEGDAGSRPLGTEGAAVPGGATSASAPTSNLVKLYETKQWLQAQISQHEAALRAARDKSPASSTDPEKLMERTIELQDDLLKKSSENQTKELILKQLQLGDTLCQVLFPTRDDGAGDNVPPTSALHSQISDLVEKQKKLSSEVLETHQSIREHQDKLDGLRKQSLDLMQRNRDLMGELRDHQETKEKQVFSSSSDKKLRDAEEKLELSVQKALLVRHLLQGLIISSGVHWAEDPELTQLLIKLGQPVEESLQD